jgi:xanthine dehydrogenase large subunit
MSTSLASPLHKSKPHESGLLHTTGVARYVDDLPEPPGLLHGVIVAGAHEHARILSIDTERAKAVPGVHAVLTAADVPAHREIGPIAHDEPLLATDRLHFHGQNVAFVVAETLEAAHEAAGMVTVLAEPLPALADIRAAIAADSFIGSPHTIARGDLAAAFDGAALVVEATVDSGGQDHFYLETQAAMAVPNDAGDLHVYSSTQHPTEIQKMAAHVLGIPAARVVCSVPRLGGGFGGKESQATNYGVLAAWGAHVTGRPVKVRLRRDEDMAWTGKRHPFHSRYRAAFDADGRFLAFEVDAYSDGGFITDLSHPVLDRALFHLDNAYFIPALRFTGRVCRTNRPSNTAFRGFGGPQGMVVVEDAVERAAFRLGLTPEEVRRRNYYGDAPRNVAPYGQTIDDPRIGAMHDRLVAEADLEERRAAIAAFNDASTHVKRGIGLQPVKFGISFTKSLLNQAGALVLVYADGSVQLNHGGTEMGQGLHTKMRAVCADALGVPEDRVRVMQTSTDKVPNTSPTAASSGSDLNGAAVLNACAPIRQRMAGVARMMLGAADDAEVSFVDGVVSAGGASTTFAELANRCWVERVGLSSTGYYATPGIAYDHETGSGTPFFYFAYGVAITEVEVALLTGEARMRRVDILHDVGDSLVPSLDIGQVEGAFVQGAGWLTDEEVLFAADGRAVTVGPSTYKVPSIGDVPVDFRTHLLERAPQPGVVGGSKAVGEPPFMLAISVVSALRDAIGAVGLDEVELALPATPESILRAVERQKGNPTA